MTHYIQGDAAGAVIGKARSTLQLIKVSTGCMAAEAGGGRGDERRPVRIKAHDMKTVLAVKEIVCGLVSAHDDKVEVQRRTMDASGDRGVDEAPAGKRDHTSWWTDTGADTCGTKRT